MRLYLDANFIVYCVEGDPEAKAFCLSRLREVQGEPSGTILASRLSQVEVLVKPIRLRDEARIASFRAFFSSLGVYLADVSNEIVDRALEIRARSNLKLVDSLHVAAAVEHHATLFLTGDRDIVALRRIGTVSFEQIPVR